MRCVHKKKISSLILSNIFFPRVVPVTDAVIAIKTSQSTGQSFEAETVRKPKNITLDM